MKNYYEVNGDATTIFIQRKNGDVYRVVIDTEDLDKVNELSSSWHLLETRNNYYAVGYTYKNRRVDKCVLMHRLIMDAPNGYEVDHINHETLDNRRSNLRTVTTSENAQNKNSSRSDSSSKITGVSWNKRKNKWQCYINKDKKRVSLGYYEKIEDAEKAVKEARINLFPFSQEYTKSTGIVSRNVTVPKSAEIVKFNSYKQARHLSGVCGISWKENNNRWQVRVNEDGKRKYLGVYVELEDAIQAKANYESHKK